MPTTTTAILSSVRHHKTVRFLMALSLLFNALILTILFTPVTEWMHQLVLIDEKPQKSEVIVILAWGAYDTDDGGMPDFNTLTRLRKGLQLYRQGYADKIICVGGNRLSSSGKSVAALMKETLILYGIPATDIQIFDKIPGNWYYYDNLLAMIEHYKKEFNFNNSLFVTYSGNTFRIKKALLKKGYNPIMISSGNYPLKPYNWHNRFEFFREIGNEYYAIGLFYMLGRI
ncbi:MAG: YdcF family protein [Magnetococcus sp. YQC-5]